jgi:hypothetical protein
LVHCRRTAAVAALIAHQLFLPSEEKDLLCDACLLHHRSLGLFAPKSMERLLTDIFGEDAALVVCDPIPVKVREVLNAYDVPGRGTALESRLASILRLADAFDQEMEVQSIGCEEVSEILERLQSGVDAGLWPEESTNALVQAIRPLMIGPMESWRLPVFPQAALRTLSLMRNPRASLADVVEAPRIDRASSPWRELSQRGDYQVGWRDTQARTCPGSVKTWLQTVMSFTSYQWQ